MLNIAAVQMKFRKTIAKNVEWISQTILEHAHGQQAIPKLWRPIHLFLPWQTIVMKW